jgi:hypothetical protein
MSVALTREAISRGAKHPPNLQIKEIDLGPPQVLSWTDGTIRLVDPDIGKRDTKGKL